MTALDLFFWSFVIVFDIFFFVSSLFLEFVLLLWSSFLFLARSFILWGFLCFVLIFLFELNIGSVEVFYVCDYLRLTSIEV